MLPQVGLVAPSEPIHHCPAYRETRRMGTGAILLIMILLLLLLKDSGLISVD